MTTRRKPRSSPRASQTISEDDQILAVILAHEGSTFTNDPADAGGPTKYGITQVNLGNWRGRPVSIDEVKALTETEARAIYRSQYIRPFDSLPPLVRSNVIDMGVNAGVSRAAKLLQQMVGVEVDGWIGPKTLAALATFDRAAANSLYVGFRLAFYEDLIVAKPTNLKWRRGWRNRALSFLRPCDRLGVETSMPRATPRAASAMAKAA